MFVTNNGGVTWDSLNLHSKDMRYWTCSSERLFYFLTPEKFDAKSYNILVCKNLTDGNETREILPGFQANIIENDNHGNLWFLGDIGNDVQLWLKNEYNNYLKIKVFSSDKPINSQYLYAYNNVVIIILSELYVGHVEYRLFRSDDKGKNWKEELLPITYEIFPISCYKENKVWMNIGGGRIQWRE